MPSLRDQFAHFYMPDDETIAAAMKTGLVVPDTNVLLNLYRFQSEARDQLFGALEKLSDRLWIPHQVGLEFHRNRLAVIAEQEAYFDKALKDLNDSIDALQGRVRAFRARIALDEDDRWHENIETRISSLREHIGRHVTRAQKGNEARLDSHASDEVLARIDTLFENRVGAPMEPKELEDARKEAERRIREKIPPGYMDRKKDDPAGDYLVWRQTMTEAKTRGLPVVFITDDTKDDWVRREHGLTLGARYELREEMTREAGVPLLMMTTQGFLINAGKYLDAEVSQETVDQARELPELSVVTVSASPVWEAKAEDALRWRLRDALIERAQRGEATPLQAAVTLVLVLQDLLTKDGYAKVGSPPVQGQDAASGDLIRDAVFHARNVGAVTKEQATLLDKVVSTLARQQRQESQDEPPAED